MTATSGRTDDTEQGARAKGTKPCGTSLFERKVKEGEVRLRVCLGITGSARFWKSGYKECEKEGGERGARASGRAVGRGGCGANS